MDDMARFSIVEQLPTARIRMGETGPILRVAATSKKSRPPASLISETPIAFSHANVAEYEAP
jgi:hypothetical protein